MFRVFGMYNFGYRKRQRSVGKEDPFVFCPCIRSLQYGVQYWFPGENCQLWSSTSTLFGQSRTAMLCERRKINSLSFFQFYLQSKKLSKGFLMEIVGQSFLQNDMKSNLLNWCNLVSISKKLRFYVFGVVRIY